MSVEVDFARKGHIVASQGESVCLNMLMLPTLLIPPWTPEGKTISQPDQRSEIEASNFSLDTLAAAWRANTSHASSKKNRKDVVHVVSWFPLKLLRIEGFQVRTSC